MNRDYFSKSTKSILKHLKEFNYKLCRKGLLERSCNFKVAVGEFKLIENVALDGSLNVSNNHGKCMDKTTDIIDKKVGAMKQEIVRLNVALNALDKTINNIKTDVKSRISDHIYKMWWNRVENISLRFKKLYSDMNNDSYNHFCKATRLQQNAWANIFNDIGWINENVFVEVDSVSNLVQGFDETDVSMLFTQELISSKRNVDDVEKGSSSVSVETSNSKNTKKKIKLDMVNGYDDISGAEESEIVNNVLVQDDDNDSEVGHVDMAGFGEMIEKYFGADEK